MDDLYKMILGPVAVALFLLLLAAWREIRNLHHQNSVTRENNQNLQSEHMKLKDAYSQLQQEHMRATRRIVRAEPVEMPDVDPFHI